MEKENAWNYIIALGCIVLIVLTTWVVLVHFQSPVTRTDNAGQANLVLIDVAPLSKSPETGSNIEVSHPLSSAEDTYAYLK